MGFSAAASSSDKFLPLYEFRDPSTNHEAMVVIALAFVVAHGRHHWLLKYDSSLNESINYLNQIHVHPRTETIVERNHPWTPAKGEWGWLGGGVWLNPHWTAYISHGWWINDNIVTRKKWCDVCYLEPSLTKMPWLRHERDVSPSLNVDEQCVDNMYVVGIIRDIP